MAPVIVDKMRHKELVASFPGTVAELTHAPNLPKSLMRL
jgi:hypothetical protein